MSIVECMGYEPSPQATYCERTSDARALELNVCRFFCIIYGDFFIHSDHVETMRTLFRTFHTYSLAYLLACIAVVCVLTLFPFNFTQSNNAVFSDGLTLAVPGTAYAVHPHEALSSLYQFTILLHCTPDEGDVRGTGRIFSFARNFSDQNFAIAQYHSALNVQFFSRESRQFNEVTVDTVFKTRTPVWIAITFTGETVRCYVNGVKRDERRTGPMALTQWNAAYPLVVGTDPNGGLQWEGVIHSAAIFDRSMSKAELRKPGLIFKKYSSIIHYDFSKGHAQYLRSTGTDGDSLYVPARYQPYDRLTLFDTFRYLGKQRLYIRDIVANIFFFLPIGFFSAMLLGRSFKKIISIIVLSVIIGCVLSVSVELLQIYLPSRFSSMLDVLSNTSGAALGALAGYYLLNKGVHNGERRLAEDRS